MKRIVLVKYTLEVPVDMTGWDEDQISFDLEENSCLATHNAGSSFKKIMEEHDKNNTCWACSLQCKAEVIDLDFNKLN